jgi:hypothetical protein
LETKITKKWREERREVVQNPNESQIKGEWEFIREWEETLIEK